MKHKNVEILRNMIRGLGDIFLYKNNNKKSVNND